MNNNYSEKEIKIFNGVLKLARSGEDVSKLTSQKIADAAGIGKATIYDYFSTKEDIIRGALVYTLSIQVQQFRQAMEQTADFAQQMEIIYNGIVDKVEDSGSAFQVLLQTVSKANQTDEECTPDPQLWEKVIQLMEILWSVLEKGYVQGVLKTDVTDPANRSYVRMAVVSNVFATATAAKDKINSLPREEIIRNSYTMLVKALS